MKKQVPNAQVAMPSKNPTEEDIPVLSQRLKGIYDNLSYASNVLLDVACRIDGATIFTAPINDSPVCMLDVIENINVRAHDLVMIADGLERLLD